jgi:hypothetical protein
LNMRKMPKTKNSNLSGFFVFKAKNSILQPEVLYHAP